MSPHGLRLTYQREGCACADCRAANTAYMRAYRAAYRAGRLPLGAHVDPCEADGLVQALIDERFTKRELARRLGKKRPGLQFRHSRVTMRTVLALRWLYQQITT